MGKGLILLYHRVADQPVDPFQLCVTADNFRGHLEYLQRRAAVVPLSEMPRKSTANRIAITFDDGYRDNAEIAAPAVAAAGLPVTWFITVGRLGGHRFWWDRLTHAILGGHPLPAYLEIDLPSGQVWLSLRTWEARRRALNLLHHRIRPLRPADVESVVDKVTSALDAPPPPPDSTTMTTDQLLAIARHPQADIGAHTLSHVQLRGQSIDLKRWEVIGSVTQLSSMLRRPIRSFAYPYGSPRAVDREAQRLAKEAGCDLACSTNAGLVESGRGSYLLPRIAVGNWSAAAFAQQVEAAFNR